MQNNRNHSHRARVCRLELDTCLHSFWLPVPVSVCVCLCVWAVALFSLCVFRTSTFSTYTSLRVSWREIGGWWLNWPDAFTGSVVKHQWAQRKGGGGQAGAPYSLFYSALPGQSASPPTLLHHHPFPLIPFPDITIFALSRNFAHTLPWNSSWRNERFSPLCRSKCTQRSCEFWGGRWINEKQKSYVCEGFFFCKVFTLFAAHFCLRQNVSASQTDRFAGKTGCESMGSISQLQYRNSCGFSVLKNHIKLISCGP